MSILNLACKAILAATIVLTGSHFVFAQNGKGKFPKNTASGNGNSEKAHKNNGNSEKAYKNNGNSEKSHNHNGNSNPAGQSPYRSYRPDYHDGHNNNSHSHGGGVQLTISPYGSGLGYYGRNFSFNTGSSNYFQPTYDYGYYGSNNAYGQSPYYGYYTPGTVYDSTFSYPPYGNNYSNLSSGTVSDYNPLLENRMATPKLSFPVILTRAAAISAQQRSEAAFRDGQYDAAAKMSRQAVRLDQENGLVHLFASQTEFAIGNYDQAAADLLAATSLLSKDKWGHVIENFRVFYGKNDYVSQTDRLSQFLLRNPDNVSARAVRGFHYGSLGYPESASEDFYAALAVKPDDELVNRLLPVLGTGIPPVQPSQKLEEPVPPGTAPRLNSVTIPDGVEYAAPQDRVLWLIPQEVPVEIQPELPTTTPPPQLEELPPGKVDESDSVLELSGPDS